MKVKFEDLSDQDIRDIHRWWVQSTALKSKEEIQEQYNLTKYELNNLLTRFHHFQNKAH